MTLDLRPVFQNTGPRFAAGASAIDAAALRAFVWLVGDEELIALDWQHPAYRYSPARQAISSEAARAPVFPDGDYYVHSTPSFTWGTFGHPWQQTLTIWGRPLLDSLGAELATWLPRRVPGTSPTATRSGINGLCSALIR